MVAYRIPRLAALLLVLARAAALHAVTSPQLYRQRHPAACMRIKGTKGGDIRSAPPKTPAATDPLDALRRMMGMDEEPAAATDASAALEPAPATDASAALEPAAESSGFSPGPYGLFDNILFWRVSMLAVTISWAANFAVIKDALNVLGNDPASGSLFVAARFLAAAAVLSPFLLTANSKGAVKAGLIVGGLCAFGYATQALSLSMGSQAGTAAFICSLQSVVVPLIKSRTSSISEATWAATALAVAGVACLELPDVLQHGLAGLSTGDLVALGQPLGFGASYVVLGEAMEEHPEDETALAALQCMLVALVFLGVASASTGLPPQDLPWGRLLPSGVDPAAPEVASAAFGQWTVPAAVAYTGLVSTALTIWMQAIIFKRLPATDASVILATEPLWAVLVGYLLLGDALGTKDAVGGAFIMAALFVSMGGDDVPKDEEPEAAAQ